MKLFRNTALLFAALPFVGTSDAFAQNDTSTDDIQASVKVLKALNLTAGDNLSFAGIFPGANGGSISMDPSDGSVTSSGDVTTSGTGTAGSFTASGQNSTDIEVNYGSTGGTNVTLTNQDTESNQTLTFEPSVIGNTSGSQGSGTSDVDDGGTVTLSNSGSYYFWVGGDINSISGSQDTGTYMGTFEMTVTYTGL